ncbi:MAG: phospholipid scramblase family protein [Microscillaceae bacterium]|nr:phospholipid scramblase family protein [Microscillaceae bacterium]
MEIRTPEGEKILTVKRGVTLFVSTVEVLNQQDQLIGKFKQKFFSIGGKFDVLDAHENVLCSLKGKWTSWDFKFAKDNVEFAHVTKKWSGIGKELFTTADNYILQINEVVPADNPLRLLILAAVMCIDMVLKE